MKSSKFGFLSLLLIGLVACQGQHNPKGYAANPSATGLDSFINNTADSVFQKEKLPGLFIGVLDNGKRSYYGWGNADTEKKQNFDSATLFEIGSITKTFTAYVLKSVLRNKQISDTASILPYLPDSVRQNKALATISFLKLMNHTSGLPRLPENMKVDAVNKTPYDTYTSDQLFDYLKNCKPALTGKYEYSNLGAGLAGVLAERISGKAYAQLLDQYIFLPFKMVTPDKAVSGTANKSQGYFGKEKTPYWNMNVLAPAGGLKCSMAEMLTYLEAMINPVDEEARVIIQQLTTSTALISGKVRVGLGWHLLTEENQSVIFWHNGGTYGFSTFTAFNPEKNKAVMVVINQFSKNNACDVLGITLMRRLLR